MAASGKGLRQLLNETMDEIGHRYGPSPKAFLLITLAGSFFVDLANAFVAKGFLALPYFTIAPSAGG